MDIEQLISQTAALSWENPSAQIETSPIQSNSTESLPLIGLLISQKINNNQSVQAALNKAWDFAVPFSFAAIGPNKFLFRFSKQDQLDRILKNRTWNVNGYLISLQTWSPLVTMGEVSNKHSPFWIQIHGFLLANLTLKNAISIGKALGPLLQVEDCSGATKTFRSYLRVLVNINVQEPLIPGFMFNREDGEPIWVSFRYERLDIYCNKCGRIGHNNQHCLAPPQEIIPGKYSTSLKVNIFSNQPSPPMPQPPSTMSQPSQFHLSTFQPATGLYTQGYPQTSPLNTTSFNSAPLQSPISSPPLSQQPNILPPPPPLQSPLTPPPQQIKHSSSNQHPSHSSPPNQKEKPTSVALEPTNLSNQPHISLNDQATKQASSSTKAHASEHLTPLTTSLETCSMPAHHTSLYPGSISIELNQFIAGPSSAPNNKAQGKKHVTSPPKIRFPPTDITNLSKYTPHPPKTTTPLPTPPYQNTT
jgi:hypothetical protein